MPSCSGRAHSANIRSARAALLSCRLVPEPGAHEGIYLVGSKIGHLQVGERRLEGVFAGGDTAGDDDMTVAVFTGKLRQLLCHLTAPVAASSDRITSSRPSKSTNALPDFNSASINGAASGKWQTANWPTIKSSSDLPASAYCFSDTKIGTLPRQAPPAAPLRLAHSQALEKSSLASTGLAQDDRTWCPW